MNSWQLKTPVVLIIFNRPDTTEKVFEVIRQVKPSKLFVIADGPRLDRAGEVEKCAAARAIIDHVNWDCEVLKNYSDVNMGCKRRVSSGLDWVFDTVEEAIILEDDCLPHPTFFRFCENLLEKYRDDKRFMMICGTNVLGEWKSNIQSYFFSYFTHCWGWATWKRAWNYYDVDMKLWPKPEVKDRVRDVIANDQHYLRCQKNFDSTYSEKVDSWAFRWFFTRLSQSSLSIIPGVNLISNIGFSEKATNTKNTASQVANLPVMPMFFPLKEPLCVARDRDYENLRCHKTWNTQVTLTRKVMKKLKRLFIGVFMSYIIDDCLSKVKKLMLFLRSYCKSNRKI